jgi:hypothetical protein
VVSLGAEDRCVVQWRREVEDEALPTPPSAHILGYAWSIAADDLVLHTNAPTAQHAYPRVCIRIRTHESSPPCHCIWPWIGTNS